ncbi:hypothetical protein DCAR_0414543 [Daucus carota subsp. sativus]|uniref:non-specific serine/threonine protein kinase n=1 Tax=Daucus carota subsp. sativus TaxID=79200 RepID=A0AAF1AWV4_DAUCS|nr:hypothetical protein DCAR_0414543 [Daucus carota subsp. sativus]
MPSFCFCRLETSLKKLLKEKSFKKVLIMIIYRQIHKKVNITEVKHWCRQILEDHLIIHSHNPPIIYRDLKCDNIFANGNKGKSRLVILALLQY